MTKNYYSCWKLDHYKLLEMLDVFIMCLVVELSVASTNSSPVYSQQYAAPQQTRLSHAWIISWSVDCTCSSVGQHHKLILFNCLLIISFNKVSLPTDHHNLLTHWLGSHSEQYSMGVWWGLVALWCAAVAPAFRRCLLHPSKGNRFLWYCTYLPNHTMSIPKRS
jgi:hypothetical protein